MQRKFSVLFALILFFMSMGAFALNKTAAMIVAPFIQNVDITKNSTANVNIVVQNNTGTNLTITNFIPQIPPNSSVSATIVDNNCGLLAPQETCDATAQLQGLTKPGNENLNVSVCAFNGTLCSRITQAVTITNAALTTISVTPTNPSIEASTTQQFEATGFYADNTFQDITNAVLELIRSNKSNHL